MRTLPQKLCISLFLILALTTPSFAQTTDKDSPKTDIKKAGSDTKDAGKSTGNAAKNTGKAVAKGTKKGVHKAAGATEKGADTVKDKTDSK